MKFKFLFTFTFLIFSNLSAQKQEVVSILYSKKIINNDNRDVSTNKRRQNLNAELSKVKFNLSFNNQISVFKLIETLDSDYGNSRTAELSKTIGGTETLVITNLNNSIKEYQTSFLNEDFVVRSPIDDLSWSIENQKKEILGYTCYKAKTIIKIDDFRGKHSVEVVAWFAKELNSSFGPSLFSGLPGVILELQYGDIVTFANKISVGKKRLNVPRMEGRTVSKDEFVSIFNEKMNAISKQ